ncbi:hypothetical protein D3C83_179200 [compost metagenome]
MVAKVARMAGVFLGLMPIRPQNGSRKHSTTMAVEMYFHSGRVRRRKMNDVSSGRLPYQITRNWAKNR